VVTIPNGLTVAKDGSGQFTTINEALKAARPKMTVRVLDDATYSESFSIDDSDKHEGVILEAPKRAVIELPTAHTVLAIRDVPGFRLRGFRVREREPRPTDLQGLLVVSGHSPGVVVEGLDFEISGRGCAVTIVSCSLAGESPVVAEKNTVRGAGAGIHVWGSVGVCLRTNSIVDCNQGIRIGGGLLADLQLSGNLVGRCTAVAVELIDLDPQSKRIVLENNTLYACETLIRIWDNAPFQDFGSGGQVELRNNLLIEAALADIFQVLSDTNGIKKIADSKNLSTLWDFKCNWRDLRGASPAMATPLAVRDHKLPKVVFVSRAPSSPDFLRPLPDSELASGGAGKNDPSLPTYVGAVPPVGMEPWDWEKTWKLRAQKTAPQGSNHSKGSAQPQGT
jgi:hypothetical protein